MRKELAERETEERRKSIEKTRQQFKPFQTSHPRQLTGRDHFHPSERHMLVSECTYDNRRLGQADATMPSLTSPWQANEESQRPSWARIVPDYKFDWSVTRDRDLSAPTSYALKHLNLSLQVHPERQHQISASAPFTGAYFRTYMQLMRVGQRSY